MTAHSRDGNGTACCCEPCATDSGAKLRLAAHARQPRATNPARRGMKPSVQGVKSRAKEGRVFQERSAARPGRPTRAGVNVAASLRLDAGVGDDLAPLRRLALHERAEFGCGVLVRDSTPARATACLSSGLCMTLLISVFSSAMTAGEVPFGTRMPSQPVASKPGKPVPQPSAHPATPGCAAPKSPQDRAACRPGCAACPKRWTAPPSDAPAKHVGDRGRAAPLYGTADQIEVAGALQQLHRELRERAVAGRAVSHDPGCAFAAATHFLQRLEFAVRRRPSTGRASSRPGYGRQVLQRRRPRRASLDGLGAMTRLSTCPITMS